MISSKNWNGNLDAQKNDHAPHVLCRSLDGISMAYSLASNSPTVTAKSMHYYTRRV